MQAHSDVPRRENEFHFICSLRAANSARLFVGADTIRPFFMHIFIKHAHTSDRK